MAHPVFRRRRFFDGRPTHRGNHLRDIYWLHPQRRGDDVDDRHSGIKSVAVGLNGAALPEPDARGERIIDDSFLLCFNAHAYPVDFVIPGVPVRQGVAGVIDTSDPRGATELQVAAGRRSR